MRRISPSSVSGMGWSANNDCGDHVVLLFAVRCFSFSQCRGFPLFLCHCIALISNRTTFLLLANGQMGTGDGVERPSCSHYVE